MDTKSLAKSKRAHSQHHKKHHPNQKAKGTTTTVGPSTTNKAPGNTVKEQPRQSKGSASLPSNWDRYDDEDDPMAESQIAGQSSQQSDVVLPKSKGADYAYLISEAKSQNSTRLSSEIFPSLDDFVSDFGQGKDSFLAVRGESLLSSIQNDSFFVDDKTPASYEASFLSLNMHVLSEQLSKIDLPKRLFMEADLFPSELYSEREQESKITNTTNRNESQHYNRQEPEPSKTTTSHHHAVHDHTGVNPTVHRAPNPSKFEPKTAELELDTLLDSFADTNLKEKTEKSKKETLGFDIDGTIDDLLKETSTPVGVLSSSSQPVSKSELLDDFDSWLDTI